MVEVEARNKVLISGVSKPDVQGLDAGSAKAALLEWLKTGNRPARVMLEKEIRQLDRDRALALFEVYDGNWERLVEKKLVAESYKGKCEREMAVAVRQVKYLQNELRRSENASAGSQFLEKIDLNTGDMTVSNSIIFGICGMLGGMVVGAMHQYGSYAYNAAPAIGAACGVLIVTAGTLLVSALGAASHILGLRARDKEEIREALGSQA